MYFVCGPFLFARIQTVALPIISTGVVIKGLLSFSLPCGARLSENREKTGEKGKNYGETEIETRHKQQVTKLDICIYWYLLVFI